MVKTEFSVQSPAVYCLLVTVELLAGFPWLQLDRHIGITNALAFVSVRLAQLVHFGRDLSQLLLIDAGQCQGCLILLNTSFGRQALSLCLHSFRERKIDGMGIAKRENNSFPLHVGFIANSNYIHLPRETLGDADYCVVGQRARQTMQWRQVV